MSVINLDQQITDRNGVVVTTQDGRELSLKLAIVSALDAQFPEDSNLSPFERMCIHRLANAINAVDATTFKGEEVMLILQRSGRLFPPVVVGKIAEAIEF